MKKILVAMDNSSFAQAALEQAIEYAKSTQASIHIISVAPLPGGPGEVHPLMAEKMQADMQPVLAKAMEKVQSSGLQVTGKIELGTSPAESIIQKANEGFDAVVLGAKGKGNLERFFIGSVAEKVAIHANCSVFIIR